jgi:hypothetical protein
MTLSVTIADACAGPPPIPRAGPQQKGSRFRAPYRNKRAQARPPSQPARARARAEHVQAGAGAGFHDLQPQRLEEVDLGLVVLGLSLGERRGARVAWRAPPGS